MEQFSHDLTVALEETSKTGAVRTTCWGVRRRTRSTGNLPCAPQPTEDSSSSPADGIEHRYGAGAGGAGATGGGGGGGDAILSDSDDRQELKLALNANRQSCMFGNFESDSLNETTFSPARPNARRKRKFKRMAVEYETTPSTPGTSATPGTGAFALHSTGAAEAAAAAAAAASASAAITATTASTSLLTAGTLMASASSSSLGAFGTAGFAVNCGASTSQAAASGAAIAAAAASSTSCSILTSSAAAAVAAAVAAASAAAAVGAIKKRTPLKYVAASEHHQHPHQHHHRQAENFRANLFFCGKRKRSHRDRYYEQHSSSVPRQRDHHHYHHHQHHAGSSHHHGNHHSAAGGASSSVHPAKNSYSEYRSRNRSFSSALPKTCERIMPLNNSIVSKIERISQDSRSKQRGSGGSGFRFDDDATTAAAAASSTAVPMATGTAAAFQLNRTQLTTNSGFTAITASEQPHRIGFNVVPSNTDALHKPQTIAAAAAASANVTHPVAMLADGAIGLGGSVAMPRFIHGAADLHNLHSKPMELHQPQHHSSAQQQPQQPQHHPHHHHNHQHHHHHSQPPNRKVQRRNKRQQIHHMRLQFDDPNAMDAMLTMSGSSSSMSSSDSDSEAAQRNDTDREGDDELTDWPGNEAMVNFASKNDFKRQAAAAAASAAVKPNRQQLVKSATGGGYNASPVLKSEVPVCGAIDDDTLMSADEMCMATATAATTTGSEASCSAATALGGVGPPTTLPLLSKYRPMSAVLTVPIAIQGSSGNSVGGGGIGTAEQLLHYQVESEMSGETSNNFLSSPGGAGGAEAAGSFEVREIRAGCRRIRNERPGFTILTSVNEDLSKFLQDARKEQLRLPDTDAAEHKNLVHLANLYSLKMTGENGYMILTKTSNTMQSVKIDRSSSNSNMSKRFLGDYKRRCYGGDEDPESSGMAS